METECLEIAVAVVDLFDLDVHQLPSWMYGRWEKNLKLVDISWLCLNRSWSKQEDFI